MNETRPKVRYTRPSKAEPIAEPIFTRQRIVSMIAGGASALGALLPWVSVDMGQFGTIAVSGYDSPEGKVVLVTALVATMFSLLSYEAKWLWHVVVMANIALFLVALYNALEIGWAGLGIGLPLILVASIVGLLAAGWSDDADAKT